MPKSRVKLTLALLILIVVIAWLVSLI